MDQTLRDLGGIVLYGLPTFFLLLMLAFFVRVLYLKPLEKVLAERFRLTEGARKAAEDSLKNADTKIAEYQDALNRARREIYQEQADSSRISMPNSRKPCAGCGSNPIRAWPRSSFRSSKEADAARTGLEAQSEALATQIADSHSGRK